MKFSVKTTHPKNHRTGCIIIGVFEARRLTVTAQEVDEASDGALSSFLRLGDMEGKLDQTLLLHHVPGIPAERILLVGCGREHGLGDAQYRNIITNAIQALEGTVAQDATLYLGELNVPGRDIYWKVRQALESCRYVLYRFDELKNKKDIKKRHLRRILLNVPVHEELPKGKKAVREGTAIARGVSIARDLGNLPANICTPNYLAERANMLDETHKSVEVHILDEADMEKLGMGTLLSVARGSRQPAKLITIKYTGGKKGARPVVLVGKGVTFDSGGISMKPAEAMDEMKFDMCGAASVLGTLSAAAELDIPLNIVGIIPATENLPGGNATRPGDVVTSLSGQTVEILNTDAEGRLILSDALTYAKRFEPEVVIDIATLTGACVIALGAHASGLFTNHRKLGDELLAAGNYAGDRAWELPLWSEYQDGLKSNFADMANFGGREAGAITAACFLSRFAKDYHWAHLDIAGAAWVKGANKGATGRPVALLTQYLLDRSKTTRGHG